VTFENLLVLVFYTYFKTYFKENQWGMTFWKLISLFWETHSIAFIYILRVFFILLLYRKLLRYNIFNLTYLISIFWEKLLSHDIFILRHGQRRQKYSRACTLAYLRPHTGHKYEKNSGTIISDLKLFTAKA